MYELLQSAIDQCNEYLNSDEGWKIVSYAVPISRIDEIGRDAALEEIKNQSVDNWHERMNTLTIDDKLVDIMCNCLYRGYIRKGASAIKSAIRAKIHSPSFDYPFTYLKIASSNPTKISGIRKDRIKPYLLGFIESSLARTGKAADMASTMKIKGLHYTLNMYSSLPGCIGYIPEDFREKKGTYLKPAKFLKAVFGEDFSSSEISTIAGEIADKLREIAHKGDTGEVQVSNMPSEIYTWATDEGMDSCMSELATSYFRLYDNMPNTRIAYIVDSDTGYLVARALIHDRVVDEYTGKVYKMMDRIYYANSDWLAIMIVWAKQNGYLRKASQSADEYTFITPEGDDVYLSNISVDCGEIKKAQFSNVPYVDTFPVFDTKHPTRLYSREDYEVTDTDYVKLRSTEGYIRWLCTSEEVCAHCKRHIHDTETCKEIRHHGKTLCLECYQAEQQKERDNIKTCSKCGCVIREGDPCMHVVTGHTYCRDCFNGPLDVRPNY